ncbi:MAG: hypothetical protein K2O05_01365 [Anaeroplasmataceae bacterium]|nr:hypothetical protein [Anaeroplasmataceae bacterium]
MEKTSLEKSHSKWSNAKLTMLCVLATIFVSVFWLLLGLNGLDNFLNKIAYYCLLGASALGTILCLVLFNKFKR